MLNAKRFITQYLSPRMCSPTIIVCDPTFDGFLVLRFVAKWRFAFIRENIDPTRNRDSPSGSSNIRIGIILLCTPCGSQEYTFINSFGSTGGAKIEVAKLII